MVFVPLAKSIAAIIAASRSSQKRELERLGVRVKYVKRRKPDA